MGTTTASTDDTQDTCLICLSPVSERAITVPCNHYTFDFVCIVSWLQERSACPLCKVEVTAVQYDWHSPTDFRSYAIRRTHKASKPSSTPNARPSSFFAPYGLPERPRSVRRPYSPPVEDISLRRRRQVYQKKLYSLHIGSNRFSGYRDVTPQMIASSPDLQSRARTWTRRELRVFTFLHTDTAGTTSNEATTSSNAEFLLSYILSILKMVDVKASNGHAESLLSEFLGRDNSRLFLHELNAWLRSPFSKLEEWDENVQYADDFETCDTI